MPRSLGIPGVVALFIAFALLFIVSISLPFLTAMDITRVDFGGNVRINSATDPLSQLRVSSLMGIACNVPVTYVWVLCGFLGSLVYGMS